MDRITPKDVDRMLRLCLRRRSDLGLWNAVAANTLEPQNPFGRGERRTPQRWFVFLLVSASAAVIAFVYFNFWN